jgi:hypothetical protein
MGNYLFSQNYLHQDEQPQKELQLLKKDNSPFTPYMVIYSTGDYTFMDEDDVNSNKFLNNTTPYYNSRSLYGPITSDHFDGSFIVNYKETRILNDHDMCNINHYGQELVNDEYDDTNDLNVVGPIVISKRLYNDIDTPFNEEDMKWLKNLFS